MCVRVLLHLVEMVAGCAPQTDLGSRAVNNLIISLAQPLPLAAGTATTERALANDSD